MSTSSALDDLLADVIEYLLTDDVLADDAPDEDTRKAGHVRLEGQLDSSTVTEPGAAPIA
jgi:hypothetical protein